ncbi:hypothetical protein [Geothermobacter ehrlichii]|uniref:hypothetical protein n=1 Tax=Geothermobacter ehrlichii TaxID=213224 RepID=UPI001652CBFD|nr:hypothetical protein [Geothermobacter ehrlichii]
MNLQPNPVSTKPGEGQNQLAVRVGSAGDLLQDVVQLLLVDGGLQKAAAEFARHLFFVRRPGLADQKHVAHQPVTVAMEALADELDAAGAGEVLTDEEDVGAGVAPWTGTDVVAKAGAEIGGGAGDDLVAEGVEQHREGFAGALDRIDDNDAQSDHGPLRDALWSI